jgi:predicted nuclease of predicted toxin-antitoxin system
VKFKIDENLPGEVAELLRSAGHDARTVPEEGISGAPDPSVYAVCQREGRVLVTLDLDFANAQVYPPAQSPGIVVLRLGRQDRPHVLRILEEALPTLAQEPLKKRLWILEEDRIRMRD